MLNYRIESVERRQLLNERDSEVDIEIILAPARVALIPTMTPERVKLTIDTKMLESLLSCFLNKQVSVD